MSDTIDEYGYRNSQAALLTALAACMAALTAWDSQVYPEGSEATEKVGNLLADCMGIVAPVIQAHIDHSGLQDRMKELVMNRKTKGQYFDTRSQQWKETPDAS